MPLLPMTSTGKVQMENDPKAKKGVLAGTFVKRLYHPLLEVLQVEAKVGLKPARKPEWLRAKAPGEPNYHRLKALVKQHALHTVCEEAQSPNIETVARRQKQVRPSARYERSLKLLQTPKETADGILTKSGIMLGLGEAWEEIIQTMADLRGIDCDILTLVRSSYHAERQVPAKSTLPGPASYGGAGEGRSGVGRGVGPVNHHPSTRTAGEPRGDVKGA